MFLQKKIVGILGISYLILSFLIVLCNYYRNIQQTESKVLDRLQFTANRVAKSIDGDMHLRLSNRFTEKDDIVESSEDLEYEKLHRILKKAFSDFDISSPVYTYVNSEKKKGEFEFIVTSSESPYFRHSYGTFPTDCVGDMSEGGNLPRYKDEFGHWLSAFAPIKSSKGEIVAYAQVDQPFNTFISSVRKNSLLDALFFLVGFLIMGFLTLPHLKRVLKEEHKIRYQLESSLEDSRKLSEKLARNEEKLIQVNQDLKDFAHIASHDLKSPIKNIRLFSQLLYKQERQNLSDDAKEYLDFIIDSTQKSQKLIDELLNYSESENAKKNMEEFSLKEAVESAVKNLTSQMKSTNSKVIIKKLPSINANKQLIIQLFQNLISNGIKYNSSKVPTVEIGRSQDEMGASFFYVKDNGIGILEEHQTEVFDMFYRVRADSKYEGTGIGLAFCMRIVQECGGEIWLKKNEEKGSTFCFTLESCLEPQVALVG